MQGRIALLAKILVAGVTVYVLTGCEPPRVKSYESTEAATNTNPPRDFQKAPLDPYSYAGIAMATGGRDPKTSYGALAPGQFEGETQIYRDLTPDEQAARKKNDTAPIYGVPDPRTEKTVTQFLGSSYVSNDGSVEAQPGTQANPVVRVGTR